MKKTALLLTLTLILAACLTSCRKDHCDQIMTYKKYTPRYMSRDSLHLSIRSEAARPIKNPGKIFLKGNYIFIGEVDKGIHVINNANPSNPINIAFINIPGNIDMNGKDNTLYADSYTDLLAIDISDPAHPALQRIVDDAMPARTYSGYGGYIDPLLGVCIGFDSAIVTERVSTNCGSNNSPNYLLSDRGGVFNNNPIPITTAGSGTRTGSSTPGIAGSMARFAVVSNTLYIVDNTTMKFYDVSNAALPLAGSTITLGWNIETIFPYGTNLYIGTTTGMQIYDISNPLNPVHAGSYTHGRSCDPVAVDGLYAYITLHEGTPCGGNLNQLEVVDISNPSNPALVSVYPMHRPEGVGIDNGTLFICDGTDGLKVYSTADINDISGHQLSHFAGIQATDVIPYHKHLLMIGTEGLYQYDYSDPSNIVALSRIAIEK